MTKNQGNTSDNNVPIVNHVPPAPEVAVQRWPGKRVFVLAAGIAAAGSALPDASAEPPRPGRIELTRVAGDTVHAMVWSETGEGSATHLPPGALLGLTWTSEACDDRDCEAITYRITDVVQDTSTNTMPQHGDNSDVWLYRVEYASALAPDQWYSVCDPDNAGGAMGIFVDGQWSDDGTWHPGGWTFSCSNGVIAKCVRSWGYKPWKTLRSPVHGDVDLQPLHQACTRAARADYPRLITLG